MFCQIDSFRLHFCRLPFAPRLAARKGIVRDEDGWEERIEGDPELGMLAYLGFLQGSLVDALAAGLETTP